MSKNPEDFKGQETKLISFEELPPNATVNICMCDLCQHRRVQTAVKEAPTAPKSLEEFYEQLRNDVKSGAYVSLAVPKEVFDGKKNT